MNKHKRRQTLGEVLERFIREAKWADIPVKGTFVLDGDVSISDTEAKAIRDAMNETKDKKKK